MDMAPHSTGKYHAQRLAMISMVMLWIASLLVGWTATDCRPNEWRRNAEPASGDVLRAISVTVGEWRRAGEDPPGLDIAADRRTQ